MPPHQPQEDSWNEIFHSDGGGDSSDDEKVNCPGKEVSFPTPLFRVCIGDILSGIWHAGPVRLIHAEHG